MTREVTIRDLLTHTRPSLALSAYVGRYSDPLRGEVDISLSAAEGTLRARHGSAFDGPLEHWNFDTFKARWSAKWRGTAAAAFALDPNGKITEVRLMGGTFRRLPETP